MSTTARARARLEHEIYEALMGGLIEYYRARLAEKVGRQGLARWCQRQVMVLERQLIVALLSSGASCDARRLIYSKCRDYVRGRDPVLRRLCRGVLSEANGSAVVSVDNRDAEAYWTRVAAVAEACLGSCGFGAG